MLEKPIGLVISETKSYVSLKKEHQNSKFQKVFYPEKPYAFRWKINESSMVLSRTQVCLSLVNCSIQILVCNNIQYKTRVRTILKYRAYYIPYNFSIKRFLN